MSGTLQKKQSLRTAAVAWFQRSPANRKVNIMSQITVILSSMLTLYALLFMPAIPEKRNMPKPAPPQLAWQEAEIGALVCYELHTFNKGRYKQELARKEPIADVNQFNPPNLDTDQWIKSLKDAGITFAILTASHESGFRLWQSDANPYCLKGVNWGEGKRDILREFVESCHRYGVKPGVYIGTRWNAHLGVYDFKVTKGSSISQAEYNTLIEKEVEEICSAYGELFELWFDGGAHGPEQGGPDVLGVFEKHQKNCLFYHSLERADARWGGSETGTVPYPCWATFPYVSTGAGESARQEVSANRFALLKHGDPDGKYWMPAMSDAPLRGYHGHEWFWEPGDEGLIYPLNDLFKMYLNSVGRNSTLILGVTPDTNGLIPEADAIRLKEFGDEVRRVFGKSLANTHGKGVELVLETKHVDFDYVVLQENIRKGERVREYVLETMQDGTWQTLAKGTCIGHKRIHQLDAPVTAAKIRLRIIRSTARPIIKNLAIYHAGD